jgi:hypothetical protein
MTWIITEISSFYVGGPISLAWICGIVSWYSVFGSLAIFHWREPIIFRSFGP